MMTPLNYGRSFLIGKSPANEVRFSVESRTRIIDEQTGAVEDYAQAASCKSEDTFAQRDLFYKDNYDFLPIFGPEYGIIFRRKAWLNPSYKTCVKAEDMWAGQTYHLVEAMSFDELETTDAIIDETHGFRPIVAQTEIWNSETGLRAIIEYPVKTMNTNRQLRAYQVDTGPVAFPDLARRYDRHVDSISLAFVAFNAADFADFVIEEPAPACAPDRQHDEATLVHHYSRRLSLEAANRIYAVGPTCAGCPKAAEATTQTPKATNGGQDHG